MFRNLLSSVDSFGVWSIISMILFFLVFIGIIVYTFKLSQSHVDYMSQLPLTENENLNFEENK